MILLDISFNNYMLRTNLDKPYYDLSFAMMLFKINYSLEISIACR